MLKRLKWRFILLNMLLVGVAVAVMFGAVCILTYRSGRAQIDRALETGLRTGDPRNDRTRPENGGTVPEPPAGEPGENAQTDRDVRLPNIGGKEEISYVYTVTVNVSPDGSYTREDIFGADIDDDVLGQAVEKAIAAKNDHGTLRSPGLAWKRVATPDGTRIVFASTDHLSGTMRTTALIFGAVCLGSLLLFFGVSYLLAGVVIRPTAEAWEQQKRFVADASHDLKTPLTVILANADILRAQPGSTVGEQMQWVDGTAEEAERMKGLVNQMLELAKSEDAQRAPTLAPLSLSELTEQTVLQFEPVAFDKGVAVQSEIAAGVTLPSHEESYVRLLHILFDNAIKYSPEGETVTVTLSPRGNGAELAVRNFGTPISAEDLPHLFERFYRADKARSVGGFGLGLSIAKQLTENLKGKITVTSSERDGTVFTVRF